MIALALATRLALASPAALLEAARVELERSRDLRLPESPPPYLVSYEILDGQTATAEAFFGALTASESGPYRLLRVDVRVGDYALDNGNFEGSWGERSGTTQRLLPDEADVLALRREIWLATDEAYKGATEQLSGKLAAREGSTRSFGPDLYPAQPVRTPPAEVPAVALAPIEERVRALSARLVGHGLEEGRASARAWQGQRLLLSTEGHEAWIPTGHTVLVVEAVARAEDGARLRDVRSWVVRDPADLPALADQQEEVDRMVQDLLTLRAAPVESEYLGPVLFEGPAAVELFRQLLAPEICGTPPMELPPEDQGEGGQLPTARIGRRVLPLGWEAVDDPVGAAREGLPGGYELDFEGVPARAVQVVRDGVVRDLLMSRVPRAGLSGSTGHGRALGGNRREALPAAVRVEPGRAWSERKLRRKGLRLARSTVQPYLLVVHRMEPPALSEDFRVAFSGDAPLPGLTRPTRVERLYPDGRREPVRGLGFVGVDRRALKDIVGAGRTEEPVGVMDAAPGPQRYGIGTLGGLPASWAVPAVLVGELELSGAPGREQRVLPMP